MPSKPKGNAELLAGCARGEPEAWDETVDRFGALVWTVARSQRVSRAEAEDVRQLTWFRLMQNAHRIRDPDRLGDWLATVARREAVKAAGRARRLVTIGDTETLEYLVDHRRGHHESPEQITLRADRDRELLRAIDTLSPQCRDVLLHALPGPAPQLPGPLRGPRRTGRLHRPHPHSLPTPPAPRPRRPGPRGEPHAGVHRLPGGDRQTRGPAAPRGARGTAREPRTTRPCAVPGATRGDGSRRAARTAAPRGARETAREPRTTRSRPTGRPWTPRARNPDRRCRPFGRVRKRGPQVTAPADTPARLASREITTGEELGGVERAGPDRVASAARRAAAAAPSWAAVPAERRAAIVERAAELLEERTRRAQDLLVREGGAIPGKAYFEVLPPRRSCGTAPGSPAPGTPHPGSDDPSRAAEVTRVPLGVVGSSSRCPSRSSAAPRTPSLPPITTGRAASSGSRRRVRTRRSPSRCPWPLTVDSTSRSGRSAPRQASSTVASGGHTPRLVTSCPASSSSSCRWTRFHMCASEETLETVTRSGWVRIG
ncbi:hypothetical protein SGLAM104S_00478 [Streptomyces glaucescens]